jgi:hypothetical protein
MSGLFLLFIGILSIAGIYYIYKKDYDEDKTKKYLAVLLAMIIVLSASFLYVDAKTREIAMMTGEQNEATLAILLGWNQGGYSPYIKESWGGTGPDDDFDYDGIKNSYDHDADEDYVADIYEPMDSMRFNPYQPDVGVSDVGVKWLTDSQIKIIATPTSCQDAVNLDWTCTLYVNDVVKEVKHYDYLTNELVYVVEIDPDIKNIIELRSEGMESEYANKANNLVSYTIPSGVMGDIGQWYYDLENEVQGIISNNPLYQSTNPVFSTFENMLRNTVAGVPLVVWLGLIILLIVINIWLLKRKKEGKKSLLNFWSKKKKKYRPGDLVIKRY